ncbi:MAG: HDOD domain-containing protein [Spirochaetes bacterium]|nr:HDOD domain-containing protein [Spirochaetota bacterium]
MEQVIKKVKDSIDKMPTLSPLTHKIIQVANDRKSSAQDLTDVIQLDPVLTAKVIKMVNSAYFGLPQKVKSLKQTIVMLGINTVKNVALSSSFAGNVRIKEKTKLSANDFWQHSLGVAVASKMIAKELGVDPKFLEEYFIAGLIHDIGKVLINNFFTEEMNQILEISSEKKIPIIDIEKQVLKLSHEEIGIAIGKKWNFEAPLLFAVGKHHTPATAGSAAIMSMIVCVADTFVKILQIGFSGNHKVEPVSEEVWNALQINEEKVFSALSTINEEIEKAKLFLK